MKRRSSRGKYILVFDASALITLTELNRLDLLEKLRGTHYIKVVIPQGVRNEFREAGIELGISNDEVLIGSVDMSLMEIPQRLGEGERDAIALAYALTRGLSESSVTAVVVTDDKLARKECEKLGVEVFGTLGLIEFAKKHGALSKEEALRILEEIPRTSLYITPELLEEAKTRIEQQGRFRELCGRTS